MAENLITQAELEAYAPDLDLTQFSQATISGMISRASQRAINYCNVDGFFRTNVVGESEQVRIAPNGDLTYSFRRRPVAAGGLNGLRLVGLEVNQSLELSIGDLQNIYYIPTGGTYFVYPSNFLLAHGRGLISLRNADLFVEVDYTGGYLPDELPGDIKEAVTLFFRSAAAKKYNPAGAASFRQGAISMNFKGSGSEAGSSKDAFVSEAELLLNEYVRRVI